MSCNKCSELNVGYSIRSPEDLRKAARVARDNLADKTLRLTFPLEKGEAQFNRFVKADKWDDLEFYKFECKKCGQTFELFADTYHGGGGWKPTTEKRFKNHRRMSWVTLFVVIGSLVAFLAASIVLTNYIYSDADVGMKNTFFILSIAIALSLYMLPFGVARATKRPKEFAICLCNILFGWTIIGWLAVLIWVQARAPITGVIRPPADPSEEQKYRIENETTKSNVLDVPLRNTKILGKHQLKVRELFMEEWDPIGVRGCDRAEDEYDRYAARAYIMLMNERASADAIAAYLYDIAANQMGLGESNEGQQACVRTAGILISLRPKFDADKGE